MFILKICFVNGLHDVGGDELCELLQPQLFQYRPDTGTICHNHDIYHRVMMTANQDINHSLIMAANHDINHR